MQGYTSLAPAGKDRWTLRLGRVALRLVGAFLHWSSRVEVRGAERAEAALRTRRPIIFAFWHGGITAMLLFRRHLHLPFLVTLISRSRDGDWAAALARAVGVEAARGSSSTAGGEGLLRLVRVLRHDRVGGVPVAAVHLLDGPRGPRQRSKGGIVALARLSRGLIVPVAIGVARRWVARSWDRHRVPLPFGRCVFVIGEPIDLTDGGEDAAAFRPQELDAILQGLAQSDPLCARDAALD